MRRTDVVQFVCASLVLGLSLSIMITSLVSSGACYVADAIMDYCNLPKRTSRS